MGDLTTPAAVGRLFTDAARALAGRRVPTELANGLLRAGEAALKLIELRLRFGKRIEELNRRGKP